MADISLKRITVASGGNLEISKGVTSIQDTSNSSNKLSGSFLVGGSIGIASTHQSVSSTSGGAMTIGGGIGVAGSAFVGGNITLDTNTGKVVVKGINEDRFKLETISLKTMSISVDGLQKQFEIVPESVSILCTGSNALVVTGGITIVSTENSALSIGGGIVTTKDVSVGKDLLVTESVLIDYSTEQIVLSGTTGTSIISNIGNVLTLNCDNGIDVKSSLGSLIFTNESNSTTFGNNQVTFQKDVIIKQQSEFYGNSLFLSTVNSTNATTGSIVTFGGISVSKDVYTSSDIRVPSGMIYLGTNGNKLTNSSFQFSDKFTFYNGTVESVSVGPFSEINFESYSLLSTTGSFQLQHRESGESAEFELLAKDNDLGDNVYLKIYANSSKHLKLGWDTSNSEYILGTNTVGNNIKIANEKSQLLLSEDTIFSNSTKNATSITSSSFIIQGGASVVKNMHVGESLYVKDTVVSQVSNGNTFFTNSGVLFEFDGDLKLGNTILKDSGISSGNLYDINDSLFISTTGNIGINTSSPGYLLHVQGDSYINGNVTISNLFSESFVVSGGVTVTTLSVNNNVTVTGNNTILGTQIVSSGSFLYGTTNMYGDIISNNGMTIGNIHTNDILIKNTKESTSYTTGALVLSGGLGVLKAANILGNVYLGGELHLNSPSSNQIRFYNNSNLESFSINLNTPSEEFSIDRYNSGSFLKQSLKINSSSGILSIYEQVNMNDTVNFYDFVNAYDNTKIYSTTHSSNYTSGALVVDGGVGIGGNLNVLGDAFFSGNITISGTTNSFYSTNTLIADNIISINSGPSGTFNAGILIERYQTANDSGNGDVVSDTHYTPFTIPSQSGMTSTEIKLPSGASIVDNYYTGWWIKIVSGFSVNQTRKVINYIGSSRILTIDSGWTSQNPSLGDTIRLYNKPFVGFLWDEFDDKLKLISTIQSPSDNNIEDFNLISLELDTINVRNTSGNSLELSGGILVNNTNSNSIFTYGGVEIEKDLIVNGVNITPNQYDVYKTVVFSGSNNSVLPILTLDSSIWGFDMYLSIRLLADTNLYGNYHLRGVSKNSTWELIQSYVGDSVVTFSLDNSGVLSYNSSNYSGFVSLTFRYKIITN